MASISKNARRGDGTQRVFCRCGGEIKMFNVYNGRRLRLRARCLGCGAEARKPRELR